MNDTVLASNKAKGERPYSLSDPMVERVLNVTVAVAGELAVARERIDTLERLLAAKGILTQAEIDSFVPTADQEQQRQRWHADYIARIFRIIQQEMEAAYQPADSNRSMADIAEELNRDQLVGN